MRPMSQENVEIFREALDAFNRRDKAAWVGLCDPEYENVPLVTGQSPPRFAVLKLSGTSSSRTWSRGKRVRLSSVNSSMLGATRLWQSSGPRCEAS